MTVHWPSAQINTTCAHKYTHAKKGCLEVSVMVASLWYFNNIISHKLKYLTSQLDTFIYNVSSSVMN